jgi:hypothetical protein
MISIIIKLSSRWTLLWCKYCVHMYVNGKMRPVEMIPGMGRGRIKENDGGGEFKYDIFDIL